MVCSLNLDQLYTYQRLQKNGNSIVSDCSSKMLLNPVSIMFWMKPKLLFTIDYLFFRVRSKRVVNFNHNSQLGSPLNYVFLWIFLRRILRKFCRKEIFPFLKRLFCHRLSPSTTRTSASRLFWSTWLGCWWEASEPGGTGLSSTSSSALIHTLSPGRCRTCFTCPSSSGMAWLHFRKVREQCFVVRTCRLVE